MKLLLFILFTSLLPSHASFKNQCRELKKCTKFVEKSLNVKITYPSELEASLHYDFNTKIEKKDYFTYLDIFLRQHGHARYLASDENYKIVSFKNLKTLSLPKTLVTKDNFLEKINNSLMYQHIEVQFDKDPKKVVRVMRPFLTRYGRIMTTKDNRVSLFETGISARSLLKILFKM